MIRALSLAVEQRPVMAELPPPKPPVERAKSPRPEAETSFALLERARTGDAEALDDLCARYLPRLQRWAHGRLPSWARAATETQDLVQDALAQAVRHIATFEPHHEGSFPAYLHETLRNRMLDVIRAANRRPAGDPLETAHPSPDPSPLQEAIGQETLARYEAALKRLKPADREAIVARIEMGLPYADVAESLGKPSVAAAHMAVSRALVRLAAEMSRGRA